MVKAAGLIILIAGLLMTLYAGYAYLVEEKVVDTGKGEITLHETRTVNWQPYVGIGTMVLGGALLILGRKTPKGA